MGWYCALPGSRGFPFHNYQHLHSMIRVLTSLEATPPAQPPIFGTSCKRSKDCLVDIVLQLFPIESKPSNQPDFPR